jgi:hypothetical protein
MNGFVFPAEGLLFDQNRFSISLYEIASLLMLEALQATCLSFAAVIFS